MPTNVPTPVPDAALPAAPPPDASSPDAPPPDTGAGIPPRARHRGDASPARPRPRGLARLGPLPQRASVGHRARGLQPRRRRLGLPAARPRPQPRLPLGEDGIAGFGDEALRWCLGLALWNGK